MAVVEESGLICDLFQLAPLMQLEAVDVVETHRGDLERHWYSSPGPAEFLFLTRQNRLIKHRLDLLGQVIEWNYVDGSKTGYVQDDEIPGVLQPASTISFDKVPDEQLLYLAISFIESMKTLDDEIRGEVIAQHQSFFHWAKLSPIQLFKKCLRRLKGDQ